MLKNNIFANIFGRIWGVIAIYLFVPLYVKFLGVESFGLVGFYSTLLGIFAFADMGLTATLNREMARLSVNSMNAGKMRDLVRTYETFYFYISGFISFFIVLLAPTIANNWLKAKQLDSQEITLAIRIMGVAIAFQLPTSLYIGGLTGLQRQIRVNALQISWSMYRGVGTVVVLWLISPSIFAFAFVQLISNICNFIFSHRSMWRSLPLCFEGNGGKFDWHVLKSTWRYATGMASMALISIYLTQFDKLLISKILSLESLGFYSLAGTLATVPLILASPIATAIYPRFAELVVTEDKIELTRLYHKCCEMVSIVIVPITLTIVVFSTEFLNAWTGSIFVAQHSGDIASLLLLGQLLQALTVVPYYLALAYGNIKLNLQIGIASALIITPLLFVSVSKYGLIGGGMSWLTMNICTFPVYMYFLHRQFLHGEIGRWIIRSIVFPICIAIPCVLLFKEFEPNFLSRWLMFSYVIFAAAVAFFVTAFIIPESRNILFSGFRRLAGRVHG